MSSVNKKVKIKNITIRVVFVAILMVLWEYVAKSGMMGPRSSLIFPSLEQIGEAFVKNFREGYAGKTLGIYIANSMRLMLEGLFIGIFLAFLFSGLAMISKVFYQIYDLLVSVCDLLPGMALLPVVIIIFGVKEGVIVFLVIHAVIWPMSRNMLDGFASTPKIYVEAGKNMELSGIRLIRRVYLPSSASFIVSGLKSGWARAWRGLISAEMIFGIASSPGIGLFINQMRTNMNNAEMYATLLVIVIIGVVVQYGILLPIERNTVKKWGMSR